MEKQLTFEELISIDYAYSISPRLTAWLITWNIVIVGATLLLAFK